MTLIRPESNRSGGLEQFLRDYLWSDDPFLAMRGLGFRPADRGERFSALAADVHEDADAFQALFELPGVARENLEVTLENSVLRVSGSVAEKRGGEEGTYPFSRSLAIPEGVDASAISAELKNGLLHVRLPKHEERKPRTIEIR